MHDCSRTCIVWLWELVIVPNVPIACPLRPAGIAAPVQDGRFPWSGPKMKTPRAGWLRSLGRCAQGDNGPRCILVEPSLACSGMRTICFVPAFGFMSAKLHINYPPHMHIHFHHYSPQHLRLMGWVVGLRSPLGCCAVYRVHEVTASGGRPGRVGRLVQAKAWLGPLLTER